MSDSNVPNKEQAPSNTAPEIGPDARSERWVRPAIRALSSYHVPPAEGLIKLDAMENPYDWPAWLLEKWLGSLRHVHLNRYPDPTAAVLTERLREVYQVPAGAQVLLGNGSDELIQMLAMTLGGEGRVVLAPEPTFVMYRMIALMQGLDYVGVPLERGFGLDREAMLEAIGRHRPALVFLAYPNNPTGNLFDRSAVCAIIEAAPGLVVVDEAYFSFAASSFLDRLPDYPNLVVMRTLSKTGLAGLRLGWLAGHPRWVREIDKTRLPYNINVLTQTSTAFAMDHAEVFDDQTRRIREDRGRMAEDLERLPGVTVYPSDANFLLFRVGPGRADAIYAALRDDGVLIKKLHGSTPALAECLRVTVGTPQENQAFLERIASHLP